MKGVTQAFFGTTDEWQSAIYPLYKGVFGIELKDDGELVTKAGDGERVWPELPAIGEGWKQAIATLTETIKTLQQKISHLEEIISEPEVLEEPEETAESEEPEEPEEP